MIKSIIKILIRVYQITISPFLGARCRFYPSCSHYALECYEKFSLLKATRYSIVRVIRCNPLCEGGINLVPNDNNEVKNG